MLSECKDMFLLKKAFCNAERSHWGKYNNKRDQCIFSYMPRVTAMQCSQSPWPLHLTHRSLVPNAAKCIYFFAYQGHWHTALVKEVAMLPFHQWKKQPTKNTACLIRAPHNSRLTLAKPHRCVHNLEGRPTLPLPCPCNYALTSWQRWRRRRWKSHNFLLFRCPSNPSYLLITQVEYLLHAEMWSVFCKNEKRFA